MKRWDIWKAVLVATLSAIVMVVGCLDLSAQTKPNSKQKAVAKPTPTPFSRPPVETIITDPAKCTAANGMSLAEIREILADHNAARREHQLPDVTWNCKLAQLAQDWANQSIYEHRDNFPFGENIFVSGNPAEPVASVVKRWMLEKPNWNNETATCTTGKVCTHYAQIMWRATKSIGCGINRSATGKWKAMVVCNYDPASKASGPAW